MFKKKEPAAPVEKIIRYQLRVVANSDPELALIREIAFLEGADLSVPVERKVVGQHRVEENGAVKAVVPVYEDLPKIASGGFITIRPPFNVDVFARIREIAEKNRLSPRWGIVEQVIRSYDYDRYGHSYPEDEIRPL
jgi:hypothetical protein